MSNINKKLFISICLCMLAGAIKAQVHGNLPNVPVQRNQLTPGTMPLKRDYIWYRQQFNKTHPRPDGFFPQPPTQVHTNRQAHVSYEQLRTRFMQRHPLPQQANRAASLLANRLVIPKRDYAWYQEHFRKKMEQVRKNQQAQSIDNRQ